MGKYDRIRYSAQFQSMGKPKLVRIILKNVRYRFRSHVKLKRQVENRRAQCKTRGQKSVFSRKSPGLKPDISGLQVGLNAEYLLYT